jgi:hypothetical protein
MVGFDDAINVASDDHIEIRIEELERVRLDLGAARGYLLLNGERRPLPIGSTLVNGIFYWQTGPGFLGLFELNFARSSGSPN